MTDDFDDELERQVPNTADVPELVPEETEAEAPLEVEDGEEEADSEAVPADVDPEVGG